MGKYHIMNTYTEHISQQAKLQKGNDDGKGKIWGHIQKVSSQIVLINVILS